VPETPRQLQRRLMKAYERNCATGDYTVLPSIRKTLRDGMQNDSLQARFFLYMPEEPPPDPDVITIVDETVVKVSLVAFIDALRQTRYIHIRLLYIWSLALTHDDIVSLALLFDKGSYPIKHLEMIDCLIATHSLQRLSISLNNCSTLTSLVLDYNEFGNQGCRSLCSGLRCNRTIISLSLNYCGLGIESGTALGCLVATTAIRELYLDGNSLECEGVVDLIRLFVQQAINEDGERQLEAARKAAEEANAAQLERDKKFNYSYNDMNEIADESSTKEKTETSTKKKKKKKKKGRKSKKQRPPPPLIGPWIYKLHLSDNGIDMFGNSRSVLSVSQHSKVAVLDCLQMLAQLIMYSKCLQELDLDKNLIGEIGGQEVARALRVRDEIGLPSIKLRTTRRVSPDSLATIVRLGAGLKKKQRRKPSRKKK
jgi:hypothetical protein